MRAFITGASSGIGEGLALHYASAGATIGLCARRAPLLGELGRALEAKGARAIVYAADVADTAEMGRAAEAFVAAAGGVDLVIANAGIGIANEILAGKAEPIARLLRVNIIGVTNTIVPFVPIMLKQGAGTLAAVSSLAGFRGLPGRAAYSASKAGLNAFAGAMAKEVERDGISVHIVTTGPVATPMLDDVHFPMMALHPDDVARTVVWLDTLSPSVALLEVAVESVQNGPFAPEAFVPEAAKKLGRTQIP